MAMFDVDSVLTDADSLEMKAIVVLKQLDKEIAYLKRELQKKIILRGRIEKLIKEKNGLRHVKSLLHHVKPDLKSTIAEFSELKLQ